MCVIAANYVHAGLVELSTVVRKPRDRWGSWWVAGGFEGVVKDDGLLPFPTPFELIKFTSNIAAIPHFSVFGIYNYLTAFSDFNHGTFHCIHKMEVYNDQKWLRSGDNVWFDPNSTLHFVELVSLPSLGSGLANV